MKKDFKQELTELINKHGLEKEMRDTPDFILAQVCIDAMEVFTEAIARRDEWHGFRKADEKSSQDAKHNYPDDCNICKDRFKCADYLIKQPINISYMDKETFVNRMAELAEIKQKALEYNRKEREKAAESYITENCPFKYNGKPGKIEVIKAEHNGNFSYEVRFDKKDGTPSVRVTSIYPWLKTDKMEKE